MSTGIQCCDETWNPVVGCSRVSAGCDNCYAIGVAHRAMQPAHVGLTTRRPETASRPGIDWNGYVRCLPDRLGTPMRWRKPRRVFVNSMSDLFHGSVPFEFIAAVFGAMNAAPQHTYLVLTKRPGRARDFFSWLDDYCEGDHRWAECCWQATSQLGRSVNDPVDVGVRAWPLPNVHLGVSVEDQATFDARVPVLLECPAAVRWASAEPLLSRIEMMYGLDPRKRDVDYVWPEIPRGRRLDWVVVGGESGPRARHCNLLALRTVVEQCQAEGVPVFVKQLGSRPKLAFLAGFPPGSIKDSKGGRMDEWPADLRVRELPCTA